MRNLVIVLDDQLNEDSAVYDGFDRAKDAIWMAEIEGSRPRMWSRKDRIAMLLSGMRHYEQRMTRAGRCVVYRSLDDRSNANSLRGELPRSIEQFQPERLMVVQPGEQRIRLELEATAKQAGLPLEFRPDRYVLSRTDDFWHEVNERDGLDVPVRTPFHVEPDRTTQRVIELVNRRFARHPGSLDGFCWPVTPEEASAALNHLLAGPGSGTYEPWLIAAMDLKLLDPREIDAAVLYLKGRDANSAV